MKTTKALKTTSIIQIAFCVYYLLSFLLIVIGTNWGPIALANIALFLFYFFTCYSIIIIPICFFINLGFFISDCHNPEQKKLLGKKWIWIFVWPVITAACYFLSCLPFIRVPIFS